MSSLYPILVATPMTNNPMGFIFRDNRNYGTGSFATHVWTFGDDTDQSTSDSPSHVFAVGGNYLISCTSTQWLNGQILLPVRSVQFQVTLPQTGSSVYFDPTGGNPEPPPDNNSITLIEMSELEWIRNGEPATGDNVGIGNTNPSGVLNRVPFQLAKNIATLRNIINNIDPTNIGAETRVTSLNGLAGNVSISGAGVATDSNNNIINIAEVTAGTGITVTRNDGTGAYIISLA